MRLYRLIILLLHVHYTFAYTSSWNKITFSSLWKEPQRNLKGQSIVGGHVPIGNGEFTAKVFPLVDPITINDTFVLKPGIHIWMDMTTAMASDATLMSLGVLSLEFDPPIFDFSDSVFEETLFLSNATVSFKTKYGEIDVWIDATTNRVDIDVRGVSSFLNVTVQSLRPSDRRFAYAGRCSSPTSAPDTFSNPLGNRSVAIAHRNEDEDLTVLNRPGFVKTTLEQQGLSTIVDRVNDLWSRRQFGFVVSVDEDDFDDLVVDEYGRRIFSSLRSRENWHFVASATSKQTENPQEWDETIASLHRAHRRTNDRATHETFWNNVWNRSHVWVSSPSNPSLNAQLHNLTTRYAQNRYLQLIQAGTSVPIKFNGMLFTAQLPPETNVSGPSFRDWGASNWWQNTRLAYWNFFAGGDFDEVEHLLDYYLQMVDFLSARTKIAFGHTGLYVTETKTLFGAYDPCDYGLPAANRTVDNEPFGYQQSRWLKFDLGGDAGLPELCVMLLDYYAYTLREDVFVKYIALLRGTLDFFYNHYGNVARDKKLTLFPTQALETYQCPTWPATSDNCPTNDHPTVAALHVLTERALELPERLTTDADRTQWRTLRDALPPVPLIEEDGTTVVSPYETYPNAQSLSNVETPELYSTHPFRYFTVGTAKSRGRDLSPSIYCLERSNRTTCRYADSNTGWTQGLLNAALLGRAARASTMVLARAQTNPAVGYRFPAFMPHMQDYEPSEDHLANMNTALQLMLLLPLDDDVTSGGIVLFPAWPCEWDVDFTLSAPRNTTVSGEFVDGALRTLSVVPPERRDAIQVTPCQKTNGA